MVRLQKAFQKNTHFRLNSLNRSGEQTNNYREFLIDILDKNTCFALGTIKKMSRNIKLLVRIHHRELAQQIGVLEFLRHPHYFLGMFCHNWSDDGYPIHYFSPRGHKSDNKIHVKALVQKYTSNIFGRKHCRHSASKQVPFCH